MPPKPKPDPKLSLLSRTYRDRAAGDTVREPIVDPDAPEGTHHEGSTSEVLIGALRGVEPGSDAERALLSVVDLLVAKQGDGGGGGGSDGLTRKFVGRLGVAVLGVLTLVQPTVEQVAERMISPSSALERKLDEALVGQARLQAQQQEDRAVFIALAKWVVDCELARQAGRGMPEPPAPVRLVLVQDELTRTTGQ